MNKYKKCSASKYKKLVKDGIILTKDKLENLAIYQDWYYKEDYAIWHEFTNKFYAIFEDEDEQYLGEIICANEKYTNKAYFMPTKKIEFENDHIKLLREMFNKEIDEPKSVIGRNIAVKKTIEQLYKEHPDEVKKINVRGKKINKELNEDINFAHEVFIIIALDMWANDVNNLPPLKFEKFNVDSIISDIAVSIYVAKGGNLADVFNE